MQVKYTWNETGAIAWMPQFSPGEIREVEDDIGLDLLRNPHFEEIRRATRQAVERPKNLKSSKDTDTE